MADVGAFRIFPEKKNNYFFYFGDIRLVSGYFPARESRRNVQTGTRVVFCRIQERAKMTGPRADWYNNSGEEMKGVERITKSYKNQVTKTCTRWGPHLDGHRIKIYD